MNKKHDLTKHQNTIAAKLLNQLDQDTGATLIGRAGTGKTHTLNVIITLLKQNPDIFGSDIVVCAPTHKAVAVINNKIKNCRVATLSKVLAEKPVREEDKETFVPDLMQAMSGDVLIVDESSMIDQTKLDHIEMLIPTKFKKVIFVGDDCQLPPVNKDLPAELKNHMPALEKYCAFELTVPMRQKGDSNILDVAEEVRQGIVNNTKFYFKRNHMKNDVYEFDYIEALNHYVLCIKDNPDYAINSRFVAWRNEDVVKINQDIRRKLYGKHIEDYIVGETVVLQQPIVIEYNNNKNQQVKDVIYNNGEEIQLTNLEPTVFKKVYYVDKKTKKLIHNKIKIAENLDKALYTKHTLNVKVYEYTAFHPDNSDLFITLYIPFNDSIGPINKILRVLKECKEWNEYWKLKDSILNVKHSYAMTVHKSQGGTLNDVYVYNKFYSPDVEFNNRLIYVGITRASSKLFIVGGAK